MKLMKLVAAFVFMMGVDAFSDSRCKQAGIDTQYSQVKNGITCTDKLKCLHKSELFVINALWVGGSYGYSGATGVIVWPVTSATQEDGQPFDITEEPYQAIYLYLPLEDPWTDAAYITALHALESNKKVMVTYCFDPDADQNGNRRRIVDKIGMMNN